jgi:hypothetical protein
MDDIGSASFAGRNCLNVAPFCRTFWRMRDFWRMLTLCERGNNIGPFNLLGI